MIAVSRLVVSFLLLAAAGHKIQAHEFWIDAETHFVEPGTPIVADTRVGQEYNGYSQSYIPSNFRLFQIAQGRQQIDVTGRLGDSPAVDQAVNDDGLAVILHVTKSYDLNYREFSKFEAFLDHKDALWVVEAHSARGLPSSDFKEAYSRYAKALISVGSGRGSDRDHGLLTEIVALANPYTDETLDGLPVRLLYDGAPRQDAQIEVFEKAPDGSVVISTVRSDDNGQATVPVKPGYRYMLDAVLLREPSALLQETTGAVWESLWANLTFEIPAK